jgi:hypothetical protein
MQTASRWLNWQPKNAPTPELTTDKTPDLAAAPEGSVSFVSLSVTHHASTAGLQDHSFWADDFSKWALECCLFRDRCFGGVAVLHRDFWRWCVDRETVGCMLETFEALLENEGFSMAGGLVYGLVLKADLVAGGIDSG